jgi:transposase InsO family protein
MGQGLQKGLLHDILGLLLVGQHPARQRAQESGVAHELVVRRSRIALGHRAQGTPCAAPRHRRVGKNRGVSG